MKLLKGLIGTLIVLTIIGLVWYKSYGVRQANRPTSAELARIKKADYLPKYEIAKDYKINDKIKLGNLEFQVMEVRNADKIKVNNKNSVPFGVYRLVKVRVINNDVYPHPIDFDMFQILDDKGNTYNANTDLCTDYNNGTNAQFFNNDLNPKLSAVGYVIFDLPKNNGSTYMIQLRDTRYSFNEANVLIK